MVRGLLYVGNGLRGLCIGGKRVSGRDRCGRISMWHRGGGVKRLYRVVDVGFFYRDIPGVVRRIEYDPCRNSFVMLICYVTGVASYVYAFAGVYVGSIFMICDNICIYGLRGEEANVGGLCRQLCRVGVGVRIACFGTNGFYMQYGRAAGVSGVVLSHYSVFHSIVRMPSREERYVSNFGYVVVGEILGDAWLLVEYGSAGRRYRLGRRPVVRGVAMNPIDHPHGGGEGRGKGCIPKSPWGWLTKDFRVRLCKFKRIVIKRRDWKLSLRR